MLEVLVVVALVLLVAVLAIQLVALGRKGGGADPARLESALEATRASYERTERSVRDEIARNRQEAADDARKAREELGAAATGTREEVAKLTGAIQQKLEDNRATVDTRLRALQEDNHKQLELMRATVDEKLQGTLEKRLGESFRQVGERLEQVHKGLGEMQALAAGVGDLKKVLTNVKTRGTWGEVQLGALLEQALTAEQYATNFAPRGGGERVEFAVRLPGRGGTGDEPVWLPIDAKFPLEDYTRLVEAQEAADPAAAEAAARELETAIRKSARSISEKYLNPPVTTDFGILFLPTEGLFAEALRRPGLTESLQRDLRVVVAGPTTLWSILSSLQLGFRTLAIEQRSSEVWALLSAVKTEWEKYGAILAKVHKKLQETSRTVDDVFTRSRAVGRKLKNVQDLPAGDAGAVLGLEEPAWEGDEDGD
jgi:DNA recombination protein RmuC